MELRGESNLLVRPKNSRTNLVVKEKEEARIQVKKRGGWEASVNLS